MNDLKNGSGIPNQLILNMSHRIKRTCNLHGYFGYLEVKKIICIECYPSEDSQALTCMGSYD